MSEQSVLLPLDGNASTSVSPENGIPKGLVPGNRKEIKDHYIPDDIDNDRENFKYKIYSRLNGRKGLTIRKVSFEHSVFDGCYFNGCTFDSCDFTGCRFIGCNFHQSSFRGCDFRYATFERCQIDDDILQGEAPLEGNLRMRFARTLRMNFQQIGDAKGVNKAISLELESTEQYLRNSAFSRHNYFAQKYAGFKRVHQFFKWLEFRALDMVWGNGESALKLLRAIFVILITIAIYDNASFEKALDIQGYWKSLLVSPGIFLGLPGATEHHYPMLVLAMISVVRLLAFAFFTAILIKRFGRR